MYSRIKYLVKKWLNTGGTVTKYLTSSLVLVLLVTTRVNNLINLHTVWRRNRQKCYPSVVTAFWAGALAFVKWDYDALVPFLWDCLRLPYGAEEVSQILHGFVTGGVNIFWIYATNATGFAGLDLPVTVTSMLIMNRSIFSSRWNEDRRWQLRSGTSTVSGGWLAEMRLNLNWVYTVSDKDEVWGQLTWCVIQHLLAKSDGHGLSQVLEH